jgi:hypothetical protein
MSSLQKMATKNQLALKDSGFATDSSAVLVREAGVPFQLPLANSDPIVEWINLMEVVQMLCPVWPVRDKPMLGKEWKL